MCILTICQRILYSSWYCNIFTYFSGGSWIIFYLFLNSRLIICKLIFILFLHNIWKYFQKFCMEILVSDLGVDCRRVAYCMSPLRGLEKIYIFFRLICFRSQTFFNIRIKTTWPHYMPQYYIHICFQNSCVNLFSHEYIYQLRLNIHCYQYSAIFANRIIQIIQKVVHWNF